MPKFNKLEPELARVGRHREDPEERVRALTPYMKALRESDAGVIEREDGETQAQIKAMLRDASRMAGIEVRSSWTSDGRGLVWKRVGAHRRSTAD